MPRVFISQEVSTVDYAPAAIHGDLVFVTSYNDRFSPNPNSVNNTDTIDKINRVLADFKSDDLLVCTGAPAIMALCGAVLGDRLKRLLIWDNRMYSYFEIKLNGGVSK